jgi:hypothetical protein
MLIRALHELVGSGRISTAGDRKKRSYQGSIDAWFAEPIVPHARYTNMRMHILM